MSEFARGSDISRSGQIEGLLLKRVYLNLSNRAEKGKTKTVKETPIERLLLSFCFTLGGSHYIDGCHFRLKKGIYLQIQALILHLHKTRIT